MILNDEKTILSGSSLQGATTMQLSVNKQMYTILSSGIYTRKEEAIVRELWCNAWDSHVAAGTTDKKVDINITIDDMFVIRDYGTGLSAEDFIRIYTTYGSSTKGDTDTATGAFGIGSKSPFALVEAYSITSIHKGLKSVFNLIMADGMPQVIQAGETVETDDHDGLKVTVSLAGLNVGRFEEAIKKYATVFSDKIATSCETGSAVITDYGMVLTDDMPYDRLGIIMGSALYTTPFPSTVSNKVLTVIPKKGNEYNVLEWSISSDNIRGYLEIPLDSPAEPATSREELQLTECTMNYIGDMYGEAILNAGNSMYDFIESDIGKAHYKFVFALMVDAGYDMTPVLDKHPEYWAPAQVKAQSNYSKWEQKVFNGVDYETEYTTVEYDYADKDTKRYAPWGRWVRDVSEVRYGTAGYMPVTEDFSWAIRLPWASEYPNPQKRSKIVVNKEDKTVDSTGKVVVNKNYRHYLNKDGLPIKYKEKCAFLTGTNYQPEYIYEHVIFPRHKVKSMSALKAVRRRQSQVTDAKSLTAKQFAWNKLRCNIRDESIGEMVYNKAYLVGNSLRSKLKRRSYSRDDDFPQTLGDTPIIRVLDTSLTAVSRDLPTNWVIVNDVDTAVTNWSRQECWNLFDHRELEVAKFNTNNLLSDNEARAIVFEDTSEDKVYETYVEGRSSGVKHYTDHYKFLTGEEYVPDTNNLLASIDNSIEAVEAEIAEKTAQIVAYMAA